MELILEEDDAKMRNRHIILIHMIAVFLRSEGILNIGHNELMIEELVSDVSS